jgi:ABC-type transport system substrate-binding protein
MLLYRFIVLLIPLSCVAITLSGCGKADSAGNQKTVYLPMPTNGPNTMDPVRGSSQYDNRACSFVYQTLLQYEYLKRPLELKPLLLAEMPDVSEDGRVYRFKLRDDVFFHDDPCFPNGKGRKLIADDFFYSLKRMADDKNQPKGWWLLEGTIVGFDDYRQQQNAAGKFDYDAPVQGMKKINDQEFEVHLNEPFYRFTYTLAMFQTAVLPREAVDFYGERISRHPVGTGPFVLKIWDTNSRMVFERNPNYWEEYYPEDPGLNADGSEPYLGYLDDKQLGFYNDAGKRLPIVDRVEVTFFVQAQPMWLKFRNRELDYTTVPAENYGEAFIKRTKTLREEFAKQGIRSHPEPLLDMIYMGFNMEDPDYGGYDEKHKKIRQAITLSQDWEERNEAFYNGLNLIYDGPIPPGLDGHPEGHALPNAYRGPDLVRARKLLAEAGHPMGKGLPPLVYYTSRGNKNEEQVEMNQRQMRQIGIELDARLVDFSTLTDALRNKRAPFFGLAWGSDYPDAENNLQLFYGPNESPSSNNFNYKRADYDRLYEQVRVMPPSPERTELYIKMRDMIIEDCPMLGSMARTREYLIHERLENFKPSETFYNWAKYMDVKED